VLSLSPLTVLPCSPLEIVDIADSVGYDAVGIRLIPTLTTDVDVMADDALQANLVRKVRDSDLAVLDVEVVRLSHNLDVATLEPLLAFAGELGAKRLAVTGPTESYEPEDEPHLVTKLAELSDVAARHGVGVMLEFMAFRSIRTLEDAHRIVSTTQRENLGICLDALHFFRSGGTVGDLAHVDPAILACVQLCDAPALAPEDLALEARYDRQLPGDGDLPLDDLVRALPADLPRSVEVPTRSCEGTPPLQRAAEGFQAARALLHRNDPSTFAKLYDL